MPSLAAACPRKRGGLDYGEEEALRPGRALEPLPQTQVELHCLSTRRQTDEESPEKNRAEAAFAAHRIQRLLAEKTLIRGEAGLRPVTPGDVVILLRSPKTRRPSIWKRFSGWASPRPAIPARAFWIPARSRPCCAC